MTKRFLGVLMYLCMASVLRYESSNTEVVKVSSKGKITAKSKGSCYVYVYVYAQNGAYKRIIVTVN